MSLSVNIVTQFKNLENLLGQFTQKGWTILENTKCHTYPYDPRKDEIHPYVAKNPENGGYDVGIHLDNDGNAFFVCDFYGGSIERSLGQGMCDIKQGYALDELKKFILEENMDYTVERLESGELVVTAQ
jgi:hypothetical protein